MYLEHDLRQHAVIFNEALAGKMLAGIALIIARVLTVELGSQHAAKSRVSG